MGLKNPHATFKKVTSLARPNVQVLCFFTVNSLNLINEPTGTEAKLQMVFQNYGQQTRILISILIIYGCIFNPTPYSLQHTRSRMQMKRTCVRYSYLGFKYKAYQHDHRYHKHITLLVLWSLEKLISITRILSMNFVLMDSLGYASVSI